MTQAEPRLFYKPRDVNGHIEEGELVTSEEEYRHFRSRSSSPFEKRDSPRYSDRSPYYSPSRSSNYRSSSSYARQRSYGQDSIREKNSDSRNRTGFSYRHTDSEYESRYDEDEQYYRRARYRGRPTSFRYARGGTFRGSRARGTTSSRWHGDSDYY